MLLTERSARMLFIRGMRREDETEASDSMVSDDAGECPKINLAQAHTPSILLLYMAKCEGNDHGWMRFEKSVLQQQKSCLADKCIRVHWDCIKDILAVVPNTASWWMQLSLGHVPALCHCYYCPNIDCTKSWSNIPEVAARHLTGSSFVDGGNVKRETEIFPVRFHSRIFSLEHNIWFMSIWQTRQFVRVVCFSCSTVGHVASDCRLQDGGWLDDDWRMEMVVVATMSLSMYILIS